MGTGTLGFNGRGRLRDKSRYLDHTWQERLMRQQVSEEPETFGRPARLVTRAADRAAGPAFRFAPIKRAALPDE